MPIRKLYLATVPFLAFLPSQALAHPGHGDLGLFQGLMHPIGGLDHVLAMVLVGIFAFQRGGRATWLLPASFIAAMAVGGAIGMAGFQLPLVEFGIGLSIVVLGAVVAFGFAAPISVAMALVAAFAIFHGHAHGAEMPDTVGGIAYGAGFMAATALLYAVGVGIGSMIGRSTNSGQPAIAKLLGGAAAMVGVVGLLGGVA